MYLKFFFKFKFTFSSFPWGSILLLFENKTSVFPSKDHSSGMRRAMIIVCAAAVCVRQGFACMESAALVVVVYI